MSMTPERARQVLELSPGVAEIKFAFEKPSNFLKKSHPLGVKREEHAALLRIWDLLPGYTTYSTLLQMVADGSAGFTEDGEPFVEAKWLIKKAK